MINEQKKLEPTGAEPAKCFSVPANCIERGKRNRASDFVLRKGLCLVNLKLEDKKELAA